MYGNSTDRLLLLLIYYIVIQNFTLLFNFKNWILWGKYFNILFFLENIKSFLIVRNRMRTLYLDKSLFLRTLIMFLVTILIFGTVIFIHEIPTIWNEHNCTYAGFFTFIFSIDIILYFVLLKMIVLGFWYLNKIETI